MLPIVARLASGSAAKVASYRRDPAQEHELDVCGREVARRVAVGHGGCRLSGHVALGRDRFSSGAVEVGLDGGNVSVGEVGQRPSVAQFCDSGQESGCLVCFVLVDEEGFCGETAQQLAWT